MKIKVNGKRVGGKTVVAIYENGRLIEWWYDHHFAYDRLYAFKAAGRKVSSQIVYRTAIEGA